MRARVPDTASAVADFETALRQVRDELRRLRWPILLLVSGLWSTAMLCAAELVASLADALDPAGATANQTGATPWSRGSLGGVRTGLGRAARRGEPVVRSWQRLAARTDRQLLDRRLATDVDGRAALARSTAPPETSG